MAVLTIARSFATLFLLQIGAIQRGRMRREASRVSFLMCSFCVRVLMPCEATRLEVAPVDASARGNSWRACGQVGFRPLLLAPGRERQVQSESWSGY
jgi:hypothetical protein